MAKSALLFLVQNHNPRTHIWAGLLLERKLTLWHLLLCWTPDTGKKKSADGSMSRASRPEDRVTLRTRRSRHAAQFFLPSSLAFSCYFLHFLFLSINLTLLTSLLPLKSYVYRLPPPLPLPLFQSNHEILDSPYLPLFQTHTSVFLSSSFLCIRTFIKRPIMPTVERQKHGRCMHEVEAVQITLKLILPTEFFSNVKAFETNLAYLRDHHRRKTLKKCRYVWLLMQVGKSAWH